MKPDASSSPPVRRPAPRVLYLQSGSEDYQSDSLLHGLRVVLGDRVVDVPRRDPLYEDFGAQRRASLYGHGFTLYGRLPDVDVVRNGWMPRALDGEFDLIVIGDIFRYWAPWVQLRPHLARLHKRGTALAAIDGGDPPWMYPHGPTWWRQMRPWPLPRADGRIAMFKRELSPMTAWFRSYGLLPPRLAERRLARHVHPIAFSIPEDCLAAGTEPKRKLMAAHVVDPQVAKLLSGGRTGYAFEREQDYYNDLRSSRFGVTTKKAGWETLRHYEIAASGCVPCFRNLDRKPTQCAPFGLDATNCVPYRNARELLAELEEMDEDRYTALRAGALEWARRNTTRIRATDFLATLGFDPPAAASAAHTR